LAAFAGLKITKALPNIGASKLRHPEVAHAALRKNEEFNISLCEGGVEGSAPGK
jgi:hypothetical protein